MSNEPRIFNPQDAPYSEEAEEAVIGAVLINPDSLADVSATLRGEDFYFLRHQFIFDAMLALYKDDKPVDYLMLTETLRQREQLDSIGGVPYLTRLINNTPTSLHAVFYAEIVLSAAIRRRLLAMGDEIKAHAMNEQESIETILNRVTTLAINVAHTTDIDSPTMSFLEALQLHFDRVEYAFNNPGQFNGITSSIPEINDWNYGGYHPGELVVFGGRPGMGKSSVLVSEAIHAAKCGKKVILFSLEMSMDDLVGIALAGEADIAGQRRMLSGKLSQIEYSRYVDAASKLAKTIGDNLYLVDISTLTPMRLVTRCRMMQMKHGLDAVFVDYIQLLTGGKEGDYWNRQQEIGFITRSLKRMAKDLNVPVITAAQISRESEKGLDTRPKLHHLRESGDIEADANIVIGCWRDMKAKTQFVDMELIPLKGRDADVSKIIHVLFEPAKKRVLPKARNDQLDPAA